MIMIFLFLQIIHSTVVDTAIVFPHRLGLPYKRALKTLMAEYARKIIQDSGKCFQIYSKAGVNGL